MIYLIIQTFLLLLLAAIVGGIIGWYLKKICCERGVEGGDSAATSSASRDGVKVSRNADAADSTDAQARSLTGSRASGATDNGASGNVTATTKGAAADSNASAKSAATDGGTGGDTSSSDAADSSVDSDAANGKSVSKLNDDGDSAAASQDAEAARKEADAVAAAADAIDDDAITDDFKPEQKSGPDGDADNLQLVKGIGPVLNKTLNELGVFHFQQIADWSAENVAWVNKHLAFKGRIQREDWIAQAKILAKGGDTEFSAAKRNK